MKRNKLSIALTIFFAGAFASVGMAQSAAAGDHITICHRTGSATNPYVEISPDVEGVIDGHLDHDQTGNGLGGDIIPEFKFKGKTYSKNLSTDFGGVTGADILANGCVSPKSTPTPTPTPPGMTPTPTPDGDHVTICHRTGSATNPYVEISPDVEGVINGHLDHNQIGNGLGGDIIPVFVYQGKTYSKNLDTIIGGMRGADILANHCVVSNQTPTPTPPGMTPTPTPPGMTPTPPVPTPEPGTIVLFGTGLMGLGAAGVRRLFGRNKSEEVSEDQAD